MKRLLVLFVTLAATGCSSPVDPHGRASPYRGEVIDGVSLSIGDTIYRSPESASVTLSNESSSAVEYNACTAVRDRRVGSSWERIVPFRLCNLEGYTVGAGRRATFEESISDEWEPGEYRIVLTVVSASGEAITVSTHSFRVAGESSGEID